MLLSADTAAYVPLLIHSLAAAKDQPAAVAAVIRHLLANGLLPSSESQSVIGYPIRCAEPWARYQPAQIPDAASYHYQATAQDARWWQYVCTLIPVPGAAADYGQQRLSPADPQDSPANMSGAQQIWPGARLLTEPGQSHSMNLQAWLHSMAATAERSELNRNRRDASCRGRNASAVTSAYRTKPQEPGSPCGSKR